MRNQKIILIDGENFIHSMLKLAHKASYEIDRNDLLQLNVRRLLSTVVGSEKFEAFYFGTKLRLNTISAKNRKKVDTTRQFQAKWINILKNQQITFIKAGYLRVREGENCPNCGHQEEYLLEKGVDVALAVRMLEVASPKADLVIVSSDTDLLPAYAAARRQGAKITYVGFEASMIYALSASSDKKTCITFNMIKSLLRVEDV